MIAILNLQNLQKMRFDGAPPYDIPMIEADDIDARVLEWIPFNYALSASDKKRKGVHFYIDDYSSASGTTLISTCRFFRSSARCVRRIFRNSPTCRQRCESITTIASTGSAHIGRRTASRSSRQSAGRMPTASIIVSPANRSAASSASAASAHRRMRKRKRLLHRVAARRSGGLRRGKSCGMGNARKNLTGT